MRNDAQFSAALLSLSLVFYLVFLPDCLSGDEVPWPIKEKWLASASTEDLVTRALELSKQLEPRLAERLEAWKNSSEELAKTREELLITRSELAVVKAELDRRSNDSTLSEIELKKARTAVSEISSLLASSELSWKSSIAVLDAELNKISREARVFKAVAIGALATSAVAVVWASFEHMLRKAGVK